MPSIHEAMGADLSQYEPAEPSPRPSVATNTSVGPNPVLACPLPPMNADPDVLRQAEANRSIPTYRVIPLPQQIATTAPSRTAAASTSSSSGSSSSSSSTTNLVAASVSFNVATLTSLASASGQMAVTKKSFQLLSISANSACEVRLYGTALAQLIDNARVTDDPVPAETSQNVIVDVVLDTAPLIWNFQNVIGVNGDTPQTGTIYITVVNNTGSDIAGLTVTLVYLPLES